MTEKPKMKIQLILEGDTEFNYFRELKREEKLDIVYKQVNVGGGGYKTFIDTINKESDLGFVAKYIVLDYDRALDIPEERESIKKIIALCNTKNKYGRIPYFLIINNYDFEYFACLHSQEYCDGDTTQFIKKNFGYDSMSSFKADRDIYYLLHKRGNNKNIALAKIERDKRNTIIKNKGTVKRKGINITVENKGIIYTPDCATYKNTNINELFDILYF